MFCKDVSILEKIKKVYTVSFHFKHKTNIFLHYCCRHKERDLPVLKNNRQKGFDKNET